MKSTLQLLKAILLLLSTCIIGNKIYSQPGTLDLSFGNGGKVTTFDSGYNFALASAIQNDGKIILGGFVNKDGNSPRFGLVRYLTNGTVDSSFGINGQSVLDSLNNSLIESIVLQSDGKIIVGGFTYYPFNYALARFLPNGNIDSSFGKSGLLLISFGNEVTALGYSVALQSDGKILLTGILRGNQTSNIGIIRCNSNGNIDSSFGTNGKVQTLNNDFFGIPDIILLKNEKILVSASENGITFLQYNKNGTPDLTFGINGKVQTYISTYVSSMIIQNSNRILVVGDTNITNKNSMMVARFKLNGQLDSTFGLNGKTIADFNGFTYTTSIATQSNGNIIVAGTETFDTTSSFFIMAGFNKNGIADTSFGVYGKVSTTFGESFNESNSIVIQKDDKIILSGHTANKLSGIDVTAKFAVARYNNDVVLPVSLLSFTATKQQQSVLLNWQTANEINNNYFSIERSNSNKNFSEINKVQAANNPSKINFYTATDLKPFNGWNYYRLKQVDKDGKFSYSSIASVLFNDNILITVYPNPANNFVYVDGLKQNIQANILITDAKGKTVLTTETIQPSTKLNIQNLSSGIYYIAITQDGKTINQKFIKQ